MVAVDVHAVEIRVRELLGRIDRVIADDLNPLIVPRHFLALCEPSVVRYSLGALLVDFLGLVLPRIYHEVFTSLPSGQDFLGEPTKGYADFNHRAGQPVLVKKLWEFRSVVWRFHWLSPKLSYHERHALKPEGWCRTRVWSVGRVMQFYGGSGS